MREVWQFYRGGRDRSPGKGLVKTLFLRPCVQPSAHSHAACPGGDPERAAESPLQNVPWDSGGHRNSEAESNEKQGT